MKMLIIWKDGDSVDLIWATVDTELAKLAMKCSGRLMSRHESQSSPVYKLKEEIEKIKRGEANSDAGLVETRHEFCEFVTCGTRTYEIGGQALNWG